MSELCHALANYATNALECGGQVARLFEEWPVKPRPSVRSLVSIQFILWTAPFVGRYSLMVTRRTAALNIWVFEDI